MRRSLLVAASIAPLLLASATETLSQPRYGGGGFRAGGFHGGGFHGGFHGGFRHGGFGFRRFGPGIGLGLGLGFGLGYPYYGYGYGYPYYAGYGGCFRPRRVWTGYGWRWVRVNVCRYYGYY